MHLISLNRKGSELDHIAETILDGQIQSGVVFVVGLKAWSFVIVGAFAGLGMLDDDDAIETSAPSSVIAPKVDATPSKLKRRTSPQYETLYVTGSVVNVRSGPSTSFGKLFQLKRGQQVTAIASEGGWVNLSSSNRVGWMSGRYLSANKPTVPKRTTQPTTSARKTKVAQTAKQKCHSSYTGACVPLASDVDCAGGSGNGPKYVRGPVRVIGPDVYGLDRDRDGIGCE